jgi:beta-lactamase class A
MILMIPLLFVMPSVAQEPSSGLDGTCDPKLQQGLKNCLNDLQLKGPAARKDISVALVDITDPSSPRYAYVNPNEMIYAASLPKIAILLGAFERIEKGDMVLDAETREKLTSMIRVSSNEAATEMLNRVGKDYLARLLQSPQYRLYDPDRNGGLWVGKEYGKSPAWQRDPIHNLSHGATVLQVARFYYMLERGLLVSPESSHRMKAILADPAINHKFVKGLKAAHPDARIYRKSGTWKSYHSDSAIVEHDGRRYIAVALVNSPRGGRWLSDLIVALDSLIFETQPSPN